MNVLASQCMGTGRPSWIMCWASWLAGLHWLYMWASTASHRSANTRMLMMLCDWHPVLPLKASSVYLAPPLPGSRASATARLRDRRLLRRRRGLIPIQRVCPEEGTEEDESARIQFKQDKAGAAGLETSRAVGGARLFCGSQTLRAAELCGLCFSSFPCWCFCFLKLENHLENKNEVQQEIFLP